MRAGSLGDRGLKASKLAGESPLLRSGIALAGANRVSQRGEGEEGDDGYLTALEVAQLDWKGTELVVISACESERVRSKLEKVSMGSSERLRFLERGRAC